MGNELRFDNQTVVVTGAGAGLGRAYALLFAGRGANVVVNDLGGSFNGESRSSAAADAVVEEIRKSGGNAVPNYDGVENGDKIIETAIQSFGRIDVLINNAGILRDISFKNMTDHDWDLIMKVHVHGAYKCTRAAWPHFRKQKYGRIVNTASAAGLYGAFGQCNYSAAKLALVGFTETLAKEGFKYNIMCNVIAPIAASRLTQTVMDAATLAKLKPEFVTPLVAVLVHPANKDTGGIYEAGGGYVAKFRWQRANGLLCKPDKTLSPETILQGWEQVVDYSKSAYPNGAADFVGLYKQAMELSPSTSGSKLDFKGKVAVITGGGAGLGRSYCLLFAKLGAKVVVNDLTGADSVVNEIRQAGGDAQPANFNVLAGQSIIDVAINKYGRIDILVNNAGILKDKSFVNMSDSEWQQVLDVHLRGTYACTKAAWPYFLKQKYGRLVNTTSTSGVYGSFGQANYSTAKTGILGFSRALAYEGRKYNIYVNTVAPCAGTQLTASTLPEELMNAFKPDFNAPFVVLLSSDVCPQSTGGLYELGPGWYAQTRWERSGGASFSIDEEFKPEHVASAWESISTFTDGRANHPQTVPESMKYALESSSKRSSTDSKYLANIKAAKNAKAVGTRSSYKKKDVILYNLGLGCTRKELKYVFEKHADFQVLPTFGVLSPFEAEQPFSMSDLVPNFSMQRLLHGEQFLEVRKYPIPTEATLVSYPFLIDVVDKGQSAVISVGATVKDANSGADIFYSEWSVFVRGCGGFGGPSKAENPGRSSATYPIPKRRPDKITEEKTHEDLAALYRLNGDYNPLHIDPGFSQKSGFETPILHGLCSFGISGKHVIQQFGGIKRIKVRFAGVMLPGQTLATEMWKEGNMVIFQTRVAETGKLCISQASAELFGDDSKL